MDGPAAIRFVTGPRCDADLGGPDDCDSNGVHDECDLGDGAGDCNRNGVIDACEIASGASDDCNENGTPDACEVATTLEASSGPLLPIGSGEPQSFSFAAEPATGDVSLHFTASGNLGLPFELINVNLGDTALGAIFQTDGSDCPEVPDETTVVVDAATYNAAIDGGTVTVTMTPNGAVDARACNDTSFITVAVSAPREPANDADGNGVPDDCSACPTDLDGSGSTGFADLNMLLQDWGPCGKPCPTDLDDNGSTGFSDLMILLSQWGPCTR
jgi:hypothetical protein